MNQLVNRKCFSARVKTSAGLRPSLITFFLGALVICVRLAAQVPAYDFYPEFRKWWFALPAEQRRTMDMVIDLYQHKLGGEGVSADEIGRRLDLIQNKRRELESDFWDRYFTVHPPAFLNEPNSWLVSAIEGRTPGRALDVGMGQGRNTLYLARLGWDVTGFDPAAKANWPKSVPNSKTWRSTLRSRWTGTLILDIANGT